MTTRRDFLRFLARAGVTLPILNQAFVQKAFASDPLVSMGEIQAKDNDKVLVLVRLFGGNDGLNTLVPFTDPLYYKYRSEESAFKQAILPQDVLAIEGHDTLGFHPEWKLMRELFNEGKMTVIQNVGYPNQELSHFRSTDIWLSASDADVFDESGWIGRYFENKFPQYPDELPAAPFSVEFANSLSRLSMGKKAHLGYSYPGKSDIPWLTDSAPAKNRRSAIEQEYIRNAVRLSGSFLKTLMEAEERFPKNTVEYPALSSTVGEDLARAARLIASGLSTKVYSITSDLVFDTHDYHLRYHAEGLRIVAEAVHAFQRDIEKMGLADRVLLLIYSEFGRRVIPNGSGLDHGAAAPVFLVGNNVKGGIIGRNPDIANLDENGNLRFAIDFRQVYASLLEQWFGERINSLSPVILPHTVQSLPIIQQSNSVDTYLSCFPNPCNSILNIPLRNTDITSVTVSTAEGRSCTLPFEKNGIEYLSVDVRALAAGMYYMQIRGTTTSYTTAFIKTGD